MNKEDIIIYLNKILSTLERFYSGKIVQSDPDVLYEITEAMKHLETALDLLNSNKDKEEK